MPDTPFSVLLTTYPGDRPDELKVAMESVVNQTLPPSEILIMEDGPLPPELDEVVRRFRDTHPDETRRIRLPENRGRGTAARIGVEECQHYLIALMSADDISVVDRFERQVKFLDNHPSVAAVGGYVTEFSSDPNDPDTIRKVPTAHMDISALARFRSPMTEVTVMLRRDAVLAVGNYRDQRRLEDYDLWVRLLQDGAQLSNLPQVLVKMRTGELYQRRGGVELLRADLRLHYRFLKTGFIGLPQFLYNVGLRILMRLVPSRVRRWISHRRIFQRFIGRENAS